MSHQFLIILAIFASYIGQIQADGKRDGKTRSLDVVLKDCHEIKQRLIESGDGIPQWEPNCTAMMTRDAFSLGVLERLEKKAPMPPPADRIIALKPGETEKPTLPVKLPESYNARDVYGNRCPSFDMISNQGNCSNCWAVATTYMINDRTCMYSKEGTPQKFYSAKHLTTCVKDGCHGAYIDNALDFWFVAGITTGGFPDANQPPGCKAYFSNFHVDMQNGYCNHTCDDQSLARIKNRSFAGSKPYSISSNQAEIMNEIYLYGPVIASFNIYEDFYYYYQAGVYKRVSDKYVGRHATKLYGWGTENGIPFWYAANSWGSNWAAEDGYFRIQRGTNEAGIEAEVYAAMPINGVPGSPSYLGGNRRFS